MATYENYSLLSRILADRRPDRPMIIRPKQKTMAKNLTSATPTSVHRLMLTFGCLTKDNSHALLYTSDGPGGTGRLVKQISCCVVIEYVRTAPVLPCAALCLSKQISCCVSYRLPARARVPAGRKDSRFGFAPPPAWSTCRPSASRPRVPARRKDSRFGFGARRRPD